MVEPKDVWSEEARRVELPLLRRLVTEALSASPSPDALRTLAVGAAAGTDLSAEEQARAAGHVRWGLESKEGAVAWDAAHAAGELELGQEAALAADLLSAAQAAKRHPPSVRARAAEAYGRLAAREEAGQALDALRTNDESWTVRRLAQEAARDLARPRDTGDPFARYRALVRCERLRAEADDESLGSNELAKLGLLLPAAGLSFLAELFAGGRMVLVDDDVKGAVTEGESWFLTPPVRLARGGGAPGSDLENANEYVWTRYVDGARKYPKLDEDYALKRYQEYYRRGWVDAEAYNYGVLLFEAAFRDDARRVEHLLRCRDVLAACQLHSNEEWDVVDDRLLEAQDIIAEEGLSWPDQGPGVPFAIGTWNGVSELRVDLERPGVFAHDTDLSPQPWRIAPSLCAFINAPALPRPGGDDELDPVELLTEAGTLIDAGKKKSAARRFADALDRDTSPAVVSAAARLLQREDLTPLDAAQLLSGILMVGDRKSAEAVKQVFQALSAEDGVAMIEAVAPHDEDGSQIALLVNAAAGLRKRSHASVKAVAKQAKDVRGKSHNRTLRNNWYK